MSKELYFTDGNNEVKYLDTTASFNLAITQDGSAFDLTNATAIDVKVANDTGYVFDKSIDMTTIKQPLAGLITMPVDAEVMNALVPDDYTIEVWVTLSSLITPGSQEGLTDTGSTTTTATPTTTYNAIFPSDDPQGFTITENVMSDSGDVIPVMSFDEFQQEFDQLKTDLTNKVATLQGPKGDPGEGLDIKGQVTSVSALPTTATEGDGYLVNEELYVYTSGAWKDCGPIQGPQGIQGKTGTGVSSTTIQYQISNSATTAPTGAWSNSLIATTQVNPFLWTQVTLNYDDGTSKSFYLVSSKGDKGDTGATGDTGPVGPPGPVGAGLVVKGTVSNESQLPITGNQEGYCYFVGTDLYVWDSGTWKNCGSVSPDLSNYVTVTDLNNGLSSKVNVSDMRKPASDVAGIEEVNAKQNKIGYTPADDSKVVHTTDTSNWQKQAMFNPGDYVTDATNSTTDFAKLLRSKYNKPGVVYIRDNTSFVDAVAICEGNGWWHAYGPDAHGNFIHRRIRESDDTGWVINADDSKVAHLSGANNFDTVPTVNNNPLLLASSLPSDLARTGSNQEFTGKNTFDVAPIDKTTGNPYITKDGVPAVPSTLADTTKDANFTGKLQKSGIDVATKSDVTTAVNTATANMVDSSKSTNFTAGLKSGGVDVATAADLKSVEASAWRQLDNKYISGDKFTVSSDTIILYRIDEGNKRLYLQGTVAGRGDVVLVTIALTSIVKTVLTASGKYLGYNDSSTYTTAYTYGSLSNFTSTEGIFMRTTSEGKAVIIGSSYITYDELV
ncbi:hypothetical protein [Levilactobacillus sp. HBUAS70063]|uniref:hypothetical protein n=1 Tax=Levilactobacillus sp. HBUAS70063 TaxID=3109359 RepID=UPI003132E13A